MTQQKPPLPGTEWSVPPMDEDKGDNAPVTDWAKHRYSKHPDQEMEKDTDQDNVNPIHPTKKG